MYQRIVVPLDGSDLAELALDEATQMAKLTSAPMHLVRVVDFRFMAGYGGYGLPVEAHGAAIMAEAEETAAAAYLKTAATRVAGTGVVVDTQLLQGAPAPAIVSVLKPGDLLVMATHGRGGVTRWFLGSVAEDVLRQSHVPVLLVRAGNVAVTPMPDKDEALVS